MGSIRDIGLKVKWGSAGALEEWGTVLIIILVALSSFGIGRLSALESARPTVSMYAAQNESEPQGMYIAGLVVASKNGRVYHYPWCSGASQIKPENQLWFASREAAEKAGYTPSKSCDGLISE